MIKKDNAHMDKPDNLSIADQPQGGLECPILRDHGGGCDTWWDIPMVPATRRELRWRFHLPTLRSWIFSVVVGGYLRLESRWKHNL